MLYLALSDDGEIHNLCDCSDFKAAYESAKDRGIKADWIFDRKAAQRVANTINYHLRIYPGSSQKPLKRDLTAQDIPSWLETLWEALDEYQERCLPNDLEHENKWDDICTAMAWIREELGLPDEITGEEI